MAFSQIGVENILERAGEVAVRVDEPGHYRGTRQIDDLGIGVQCLRLLTVADEGDAAIVGDEHRLGAGLLIGEGEERRVAEQLSHGYSFRRGDGSLAQRLLS